MTTDRAQELGRMLVTIGRTSFFGGCARVPSLADAQVSSLMSFGDYDSGESGTTSLTEGGTIAGSEVLNFSNCSLFT